jgi:hypothetical protein
MVWGYALGWFLVTDPLKLLAYRVLAASATAEPKRSDALEAARVKPDVRHASLPAPRAAE